MDLKREIAIIRELEKVSSDAQKKRREKLQGLRERVLSGESTGDKIIDFVIAVQGSIEEETERPYRQLQEMLRGKEGKQVLVVGEEIEFKNEYSSRGGSGTNVKSTLRLGVLTAGLEFAFRDSSKEHRLVLPTKNYASRGPFSDKWELNEGNIIIPYSDFLNFDPKGVKTEHTGGAFRSDEITDHSSKLLINVGREQIQKYFKSTRSLYKDDFSYVEALKLLGIENQAPKDFIIGYDQEIREKKEGIINTLRKSDLTRDGAKRALERAVGWGMHDEELILDGERPGETLDVRTFIRTLCDKYEVPYSNSG